MYLLLKHVGGVFVGQWLGRIGCRAAGGEREVSPIRLDYW